MQSLHNADSQNYADMIIEQSLLMCDKEVIEV